jgi:Ribonuclease G/E
MEMLTREIGDAVPEVIEGVNRHVTDLRPEYCQYQDEGCENAASCLDCPFPRCLYEEPHGRKRWMKDVRNREIKRLYTNGKQSKELARIFSVSERTIQRVIKGE